MKALKLAGATQHRNVTRTKAEKSTHKKEQHSLLVSLFHFLLLPVC